jgi:hypothetical protein
MGSRRHSKPSTEHGCVGRSQPSDEAALEPILFGLQHAIHPTSLDAVTHIALRRDSIISLEVNSWCIVRYRCPICNAADYRIGPVLAQASAPG